MAAVCFRLHCSSPRCSSDSGRGCQRCRWAAGRQGCRDGGLVLLTQGQVHCTSVPSAEANLACHPTSTALAHYSCSAGLPLEST
jgi:hypothetical protein